MVIKKQQTWTSRWGFIFAVTGAAVGLGSLWKFPYEVGYHGGGSFVLLYIAFVLLFGLPIMLAEMVIGRCGCSDPVAAFQYYIKHYGMHRLWVALGWWGALTLWLILSFYIVVAGWAIAYLYDMLTSNFYQQGQIMILQHWQNLLANPIKLIGLTVIFLLMTLWVVVLGVQRGIERAAKIMMPLLLGLLLWQASYGSTLDGFWQAVDFLFVYKSGTINTTAVLSALGHALFTLAIGAGVMVVYGAYLPKHISLGKQVVWVAGMNLTISILAGMAIFPLVFTFGVPLQSGPGLMYESLPMAFGQMPLGQWIGSSFFMLLILAAWTSSISLAAPLVGLLQQRYQLSVWQAAGYVGIATIGLSIGSILSFNVWQQVVWFPGGNFFALLTNLTTHVMLPLGGLGYAWFAGWVMQSALTQHGLALSVGGHRLWLGLVRYVVPIGVLFIVICPVIIR